LPMFRSASFVSCIAVVLIRIPQWTSRALQASILEMQHF
jgi:hypothetical protein